MQIRPRNLVTKIKQQFCYAAHADTTDSDKVDMFRLPIHYMRRFSICSKQQATIFSAASGNASRFIAAPMLFNFS
jgi:hypothetical protein